jgi:hypothetical protein
MVDPLEGVVDNRTLLERLREALQELSSYLSEITKTYVAHVLGLVKRPPIREDLKVLLYQSQEADNTFITSDGTSPYNSSR